MYLLPTSQELSELWRQIDPKQKFLDAAAIAINELTKDTMPYFDEIEDDIISMRRDINGFKLSPPRYLEHIPNSGHLNFKGWSFETVRDDGKPNTEDCPYVENLSSWDDI